MLILADTGIFLRLFNSADPLHRPAKSRLRLIVAVFRARSASKGERTPLLALRARSQKCYEYQEFALSPKRQQGRTYALAGASGSKSKMLRIPGVCSKPEAPARANVRPCWRFGLEVKNATNTRS